jgi:putative transposase
MVWSIRVVWGDAHFGTARRHPWVRWGWAGLIARKVAGQVGFVPPPKRWIVERTFGWLNRSRRLSKDYERTTEGREALIQVAIIHLMLRPLRSRDDPFWTSSHVGTDTVSGAGGRSPWPTGCGAATPARRADIGTCTEPNPPGLAVAGRVAHVPAGRG